jgi:hypothetical protein
MRFTSAILFACWGSLTSALCPELQDILARKPDDWWQDEDYTKEVTDELAKLDRYKVFKGIEDSTADLFDDLRTTETDV